ncbi:glycoside hydrolase family 32 protein [Salibacterium qingdaonense]|uniref:Sucrose-6-phosphate hydrolase n=1 Tax=Salibacterium qingdaonense TaxID=266892 RepID=A0A1I4L978_9BACI|nr:sucrose-6-phosphate hydrolase [Salibacterium qingdaonense]SFL87429.1 beta-fructofuranosidase [Salibacterium qingdaonense]
MSDEHAMRQDVEKMLNQNRGARTGPFRQQFHLMPPVGLMNDPNGLVQWQGVYHVFYQWMPFHTGHGSKWWGHAATRDWIHWELLHPALAPVQEFEKNGCYSGSAVVHENQLYLFYTGNVKDEHGRRKSYQCLAVSRNGVDFKKYGPVIHQPDGYTAHIRDPKVWFEAGIWRLVIGAQRSDGEGQVLLYRSPDLWNWEFLGPLAGRDATFPESFGFMWECPDFFELEGTRVLLVSPQGLEKETYRYRNQYQTGIFTGTFHPETETFSHGGFREIDLGFEFYAPQTFEDEQGRRLLLGWMGVPDQQEQAHPTIADGWLHCLTFPRELSMQEGHLYQQPIEEYKQLRGTHASTTVAAANETAAWASWTAAAAELYIEIETKASWMISWRGCFHISYDAEEQTLTFERPDVETGEPEQRVSRVNKVHALHCLFDRSSAEVFVNGGEYASTSRIFPEQEAAGLQFAAEAAAVFHVHAWELQSLQWQ